jgi:hypothetical protein
MQESTEMLIENTPEMAPETAPATESLTSTETPSAASEAHTSGHAESTVEVENSETAPTTQATSEGTMEAESSEGAAEAENTSETESNDVVLGAESETATSGETAAESPAAAAKKPARVLSYQPQDVLGRMRKRPEALEAYQQAVWKLYIHIRTGGLGAALAALLQEPAPKLHRSLYWDISKWVLKEQRIKGKNARSLLESLVYGDTHYLRRATDSVVLYLEEIIRLSETARFKSNRSKSA